VIDVRVPEPPPPEQRRYHMHDGFYFRADMGFVFARTNVSSDQAAHPSYSVGGAGFALDALVGGSPSVGFALGGAISIQGFGYGNDGSAGLGLLGLFVDGFPMPNDGLHLGGSLGLASNRTSTPGGRDELRGFGFGGSAWLGYDWWVADEWSMGTLVRVSGAAVGDRSHDSGPDPYRLSAGTYDVAILFSVLYH
jgi:hypothetical protein